MQRAILSIPSLHCDGCIASVAQVLEEFPGVGSVEGDLDTHELTVEYDLRSITPRAMSMQLAQVGFPVVATREA